MAEYKIFFKRTAAKELEAIPQKDLLRVAKRIESLKEDPRPAGCEKLSSQERYRVRQGNYRIVNSIQDDNCSVMVFKIGHRREAYR
jgi:mRNA interferase RelE/StbE